MAAKKKTSAKKTPAKKKPAPASKPAKRPVGEQSFPEALAALLKERRLKVPANLTDAPPEAYARQPASFVAELAKLPDETLVRQAEKIATYAARLAERARKAWDTSPLIAELRRRKLKEPTPPQRVIGAAFSMKRPLGEWSDAELLDAARQWSERGAMPRG